MGKQGSSPRRANLIGPYLEKVLQENGLSYRAVEERTGVSQATISLIINGKTKPTPETLRLLSTGLGLDYITLLRLCGYLPLTEADYDASIMDLARMLAALPPEVQEMIRIQLLALRDRYSEPNNKPKP